MEVKTFDEKKLKILMKECDPYLLKYIEALKNSSASWERLTQEAIKKLRESALNNEYMQLNQLRKLLLEQKQLDPEINKLVNENFWDLI